MLPFPFSELNPRLELGTPSLRVKCSTTELIQQVSPMATYFGCKYRKKIESYTIFDREK